MSARPEISAVITCYYEEKTIDIFFEKLIRALRETGKTFEIVMVNDGSTDRTFAHLTAIYECNPEVSAVIDLFKNSGQAAAVTSAICEAHGEIILSMDSDLQMDPADLPILLEKYESGYDVVSGYRVPTSSCARRPRPTSGISAAHTNSTMQSLFVRLTLARPRYSIQLR